MWEYNDREYIKVFRKLTQWEWYTDVNTFKLFMHCLIKANWKAGSWRGHHYERGQFFTSIASLSRETGLSVRQTRTALEHLQSTGEVTSKIYPKYRVITVVSYDLYQGERQGERQANDNQNDKQSTSKTASNRQANDNRYKNNKNNKKVKNNKDAPPVAPEGAPDAYGAPPPGWDEACEKQFQEDAPQNPGKTRQDWWDFWMADSEGGDDE